jgi:hypothetical protein
MTALCTTQSFTATNNYTGKHHYRIQSHTSISEVLNIIIKYHVAGPSSSVFKGLIILDRRRYANANLFNYAKDDQKLRHHGTAFHISNQHVPHHLGAKVHLAYYTGDYMSFGCDSDFHMHAMPRATCALSNRTSQSYCHIMTHMHPINMINSKVLAMRC